MRAAPSRRDSGRCPPEGIGALYVRRKPRVRLEAQMHGGGHERGLRSGTLPTHQIVGMGEAYRIAKAEMQKDNEHAARLQKRLLDGLTSIDESFVNGSLEHQAALYDRPHIACSSRQKRGPNCRLQTRRYALRSGQGTSGHVK